MVYWYNSTSFRDDLAWAASWMYKATQDADYLGDAYGFWDTHKMLEGDYDVRYLVRPPRIPPSHSPATGIERLLLCPISIPKWGWVSATRLRGCEVVLSSVVGTAKALASLCKACASWCLLMSCADCGALAAQTDWDNMIYPATVMLAMLTDNQAFHTAAQGFLQKWLCR